MLKKALCIALLLCLATTVGFAGGSNEKAMAGGNIGICD